MLWLARLRSAPYRAEYKPTFSRAALALKRPKAVCEVESIICWLTPCQLFGNFYSLAPHPYFLIRNTPPPYFLISSPNS